MPSTTSSSDTTTLSTAAQTRQLFAIREQIDAVDSQLVPLIAARLRLVVSAAGCKSEPDSVADPARVEAVLATIAERARASGADTATMGLIYRAIIEHGITLERDRYEQLVANANASASGGDPLANGHAPGAGGAGGGATDALAAAASAHLMHVMGTMRAMRRLDSHPIAPELLETLVEAASWAPVGANRQCYRFVVVTDRERLAQLAPLWAKAMNFYISALQPPANEQTALQAGRVKAAMAYQCEHFSDLPALIVACYEPVSFWQRVIGDPWRVLTHLRTLRGLDRVRVLFNLRHWASRASAASVYPAVENLLLAARAHGLGATLTTWHSAFEQEFKRVLGIPAPVDIYAIVPVGYPLGHFGPVRRRPVEQLMSMDSWPDAGH
jgi:nitroreductase/chorismate mutase